MMMMMMMIITIIIIIIIIIIIQNGNKSKYIFLLKTCRINCGQGQSAKTYQFSVN